MENPRKYELAILISTADKESFLQLTTGYTIDTKWTWTWE